MNAVFKAIATIIRHPVTSLRLTRSYAQQLRGGPLSGGRIRDFPAWLASQGTTGLDAGAPWITFGAARALRDLVGPTTKVLEYGSGGSTVFFARRAGEVVSIEHDAAWAAQVRRVLGRRATILLRPPSGHTDADPTGIDSFASTDERFAGESFYDYVHQADAFPDGYFDVLVVDGRARPTALVFGQRKVRIGGAILLDDSERPAYQNAVRFAQEAGWPRRTFAGPKPFSPWFAETSLWTKTSEPARFAEPQPKR